MRKAVSSLSRSDLAELSRLISARMPSLQCLNADLLRLVCDKLDHASRRNLVEALCGSATTKLARLRMQQCNMSSVLAVEHAVSNMQRKVQVIADSAFYTMHRFEVTYIFADWSPFKSLSATSLACIFWSRQFPHARVNLNERELRRVCEQAYARGKEAVLLSSYVLVWSSGMWLHVDGRIRQLSRTPTMSTPVVLTQGPGWFPKTAEFFESQYEGLCRREARRRSQREDAYENEMLSC